MPHSYKPVIVRWNDAWSSQTSFTKEEADENKPVLMEEIGFLISNTEIGVTTCVSIHTEDGSLRHANFIPRGMIESVTELQIMGIKPIRTVPLD